MKFHVFITSFILIFLLSISSVSASELEDPQDALPVEDVSGDVVQEDTSDVNQVVQQIDISPLSDSMAAINDTNESIMIRDYVTGLLLNMSNAKDYLYFTKVVDGVNHYYLFYDLEFDSAGNVVLKSYPCLDIYNIDGVFYQSSMVYDLLDLPNFAYGSFTPYSALIDKQFHFNDFYLVIIGLMFALVMFKGRILK